MVAENNSTRVRGDDLRRLRKRVFKSAEAFAAACGSVSVPTIYRAERGGPILKSYLRRMARELDVDIEHLMDAPEAGGDRRQNDLTGAWYGLILATDRFGHPYLIGEETELVQNGERVEGQAISHNANETMIDTFVHASFKDSVFSGQLRSEKWHFPLESAAFVVSASRGASWLDGYITWFDLDSENAQFSKYILLRRDAENFETDLKNARAIFNDESKLLRTRRFLETGYDFGTSLALVNAADGPIDATLTSPTPAPMIQQEQPHAGASDTLIVAMAAMTVLTEDRSQAYFADGLVDDIAAELARMPKVEVLSRTTFLKSIPISAQIAAAHGATHILNSSMRRAGDSLQVNTQLVDATSGYIVRAERYSHAPNTSFVLSEKIARDVVQAMRRDTTQKQLPASNDTADPMAYELFLKGRSLYLRGMYTHSLRAAEALLIKAREIDPRFARAVAQLSICRSYLSQNTQQANPAYASSGGFAEARAALEIDPNLPLGRAALGLAHYAAGEFEAAERTLLVASDQDPSLFETQFFLARNKRLQGDRQSAAQYFEKASRLRPGDFRSRGLLAEELSALGRDQEAELAFRAALALTEEELEAHPDNAGALAFGAPIFAQLGKVESAQLWANWAVTIAPDDCLVQYNVARMYALIGQPGTALDHIQRAFQVPAPVQRRLALWMRYDKDFDALESSEAFQALIVNHI